LVKLNTDGPTAVVLWAFLTKSDLANLLAGVSRLPDDQRMKLLEQWPQIEARRDELNKAILGPASPKEPSPAVSEWTQKAMPALQLMMSQFQKARFATVPTDQIINPLTMIDFDYVDELKATLGGMEPMDIAKFALPSRTSVEVRASFDPSGRSVNFVSPQKTLVLGPITVTQLPGVGMEVKVTILGTAQIVVVSHVAGRLYLRNGIHRAYLLASLGVKEIPCVLTEEDQIPSVVGPYPAFAPHVLALTRPPLLKDMFDPTLTLQVPTVRTNKVFRIAAEELVLPAD
jgi:hypothetical protein